MACNCKPGIYAHPHEPDASHPTGVRHSYQPCQCKGQPVRKPYADRECAEDAWVRYATQDTARSPCPCKGATHSREVEVLERVAMLEKRLALQESTSRDHDAVLKYTTDRINRMERNGPKVLHFGEERLETKELKPGPVTANAFDAPEQSNAKELPKHASELKSDAVLVTYAEKTYGGAIVHRTVRVAPGAVIEIPSKSRIISVAPES